MYTMSKMIEKFVTVFTKEQAKVLSTVINTAYRDLVKTDDFNELKDIVKDLGIKMGELSEAQKRTEAELRELAVELRELAVDFKDVKQQLGGISQTVGYGLEDKIIPFMADFVKKKYAIDLEVVERKNLLYPNGRFDELNIYVEGTKEGKKAFVIGECKAQPSKKDVQRFHEMIDRVTSVLKGEVFFFLVGYSYDPAVEIYIRENYPNTPTYKSYEFELKYKKIGVS